MVRLLVCRVGWMRFNAGQTAADRIRGGGGYVVEYGFGGEIYNFLPCRGTVYGYVRSKGELNIDRLGAEPDSDSVSGVTIVWAARRPTTGGVYVVGWYRNATVFRRYQRTPNDARRRNPQTGRPLIWNIKARSRDASLLPDQRRLFRIPFGEEAMGMSGTFFPDGTAPHQRRLRARLLAYVGSRGVHGVPRIPAGRRIAKRRGARGGGAGWQVDPLVRAKVERGAIAAVTRQYRRLDYV